MRRGRRAGLGPGGGAAVRVVLLAALGASCATYNYREPLGPLYVGSGGVAGDPPPAIRVVTFNVEVARRVHEAIEALREEPLRGADVLALQEMDAPGVATIAAALGMSYVYYPASVYPKTKRDFGNAILSPWPIEAPRKVLLPHKSLVANQYRIAVTATVRVGGRPIRVYSVHFGAPLGTSGGKRWDQAEAVLADAASSPEPVVILGDFNSRGVAEKIAARGYTWLTREAGPSTRRLGHGLSFDHVLVRGLARAAEEPYVGVARDGPRASDHWPVWARLIPGDEPARAVAP
jgi:endonuclease/exonuclease/phosphatase family metal-dependent hydrolase